MATATAPLNSITTVLSDFLGAAPTLEEIIDFRLPEALEARGLQLLARCHENRLTSEELAELEEFTRMGHFMTRVKLQARLTLAELP